MTFDELLRAVRREIKEASARRWQDGDIKAWLNERYRSLAAVARLQGPPHTFATVAGTALYAMPENLLEPTAVYVDGQRIESATFPELEGLHSAWPTADHGRPLHYLEVDPVSQGQGKQLQLWPVPDGKYSVTVFYYSLPADMSLPTEVPLIRPDFHWAIVLGATASAWAHVQEYNVAELYESKFIAQRAELEIVSAGKRTDLPRKVQVSR